ncbi:hypothetical protein F4677DRAFT_322956 [Hypoxylon crocopeplum]|nr:hypothetical protein F4677DRAFT_322956 [Hypoxylon crocopeplum]
MYIINGLSLIILLFTTQAWGDASLILNGSVSFDAGDYGASPNQTFVSSPVVAPLFSVSTWDRNATDDAPYIMITGQYGSGFGPLIFRSDDLSLVYANTTWIESLNLDVQTYDGNDYLTYWEGLNVENNYVGYVGLYDSEYNLKYNITSEGLHVLADAHDIVITPNGTALLDIYDQVSPRDTTLVGGRVDDELMDAVFQERDIDTGNVIFTWRLSDYYSLNETMVSYEDYGMRPGGGGFDFGHINAVSKTADGNYLASFRHLCAVLFINGSDGNIIWNLGGRRNNFTDLSDGRATDFCYQHDARFANEARTEVTLFDNAHMSTDANRTDDRDCSRGLHLELDYGNMTARVLHEYYHPDRIVAAAMGGLQTLGNGNKLIAWGFQPTITEHTAQGDVVLDVQLGPFNQVGTAPQVYRAKKVNWTGSPTWGPSIAGTPQGTGRGVYMSWNGATEFTEWAVLADNSTDNLSSWDRVVQRAARAGFETFVGLETSPRYVRAAALDADGHVLGSTDAVDMNTGDTVQVNGSVTQTTQPSSTTTQPSSTTTTTGGGSPEPTESEGVARGKRSAGVGMMVTGLGFAVCFNGL